MSLNGVNVLVTGGTGSFGKHFVRAVLESYKPERLIVYSRDELKQFFLRQQYPVELYPNLRMVLGDVRDRDRLYRVLDGIDIVVHAAAMKQVPAAEYNPLEAIKTNILGAANIVDAAIDRKVRKVLALSTDKAANPVNLYGATKLCSDKLFVAANGAGFYDTQFSVVRYGNVVGSRGSVIPYFLAQRPTKKLTITDPRMTRFLITLPQAVQFVLDSIHAMRGGEIWVPKIPSVRIQDLARVMGPDCEQEIIGIRPGEKLHEVLISEDDARLALELDDRFIIQPTHSFWRHSDEDWSGRGTRCPDGYRYASDTNTQWLNDREIAALVATVETDPLSEHPAITEPRFVVGG
ncbi:MAG: UDP-N-acetylglucosamine 4,6-dehydratase (inverting) [Acidobacteria bacterium RIFCSPLOWO2_02_FULL_67_36]|nr:MAG: UDP-N-acetylglucosamine 4,6-dehydratase (inverting) [Acidobacteria bacterium RIFCSPLOWO2_02_FULL_67_36]OFW20043.1 MAG: UDP-N-acetylglucosamine 4,6-dehydratase (inverting) [Acidobacteria bacterium RIFCSPLOWO2_12_FULL_66_21]